MPITRRSSRGYWALNTPAHTLDLSPDGLVPCGVQVVEDLLCGLGDLGLGGDLVSVDADGDFLEWPQLAHESFDTIEDRKSVV